MKIEAGQWWRTKDCDRVLVVGPTVKGHFAVEYRYGPACLKLSYVSAEDFVEHLPWCTSFDCEEPKPPKPKRVSASVVVNADNLITGYVYDGMTIGSSARVAFLREVCTDAELQEIAEEILELCIGVYRECIDDSHVFNFFKKHFGGPSE